MTESHHEQVMPVVTEDDIETVEFEELTDPKHYIRWLEIAHCNPLLSRAIQKRAQNRILAAPTDAERIKAAMDTATYAVRMLEVALKRQLSGGADGGEDRPPST